MIFGAVMLGSLKIAWRVTETLKPLKSGGGFDPLFGFGDFAIFVEVLSSVSMAKTGQNGFFIFDHPIEKGKGGSVEFSFGRGFQ